MKDRRSARKKTGFKKSQNLNDGFFWFGPPGGEEWRRAFTRAEARERLLWRDACQLVQLEAMKHGDEGLVEFAGQLGYGCYLVKLA